jgi:hypothetical protein
MSLLEQFHIWKRFGLTDIWSLPARVAEALVLLEDEWQREIEAVSMAERTQE